MGKHEDKALKSILQGREVEKKIQVGGYDKEFSEIGENISTFRTNSSLFSIKRISAILQPPI